MDSKYQETHETWNKIAQLYEEHFMDLSIYNDSYDAFCNAIDNLKASILEIGCGPGNIAKYVLKQNISFNFFGIDVAENMIELAKMNNETAKFDVLDCRNVSSIKNTFNGIICGFVIPYLSKSDCSKLISDCKKLLEENGILYLSFIVGDNKNSGYISGSSGDRTYFYYHDLNQIKRDLENNTFTIFHHREIEYPKSDGTIELHTVLIASKY